MRVVGIDGCRGGWVAVLYDTDGPRWTPRFHPTFVDAISSYPHVSCIGVDMPIGLVERGWRKCDLEARERLGVRQSSVFNPPDRRLFDIPAHREATARSVELERGGISVQTFSILPKIAEVNRAMSPLLQNWIVEVHPEVSFAALAGGPLAGGKGKSEGFDERAALLSAGLGIVIPTRRETSARVLEADADDVLDALVAAWSAKRMVEGLAERIPAEPEVDSQGLRIEMVI